MKKACLVLEGGGNRGTYTSGVLDAFLDYDIDVENVYGVSAGALNALSYFSKQKGRSFRINKLLLSDKKCIDFRKLITGNVVNVDYILNEVNDELDPFDYDNFYRHKDNFVVVTTDIEKGEAYYKNIEDYALEKSYIKASASLPIFSKIVKIDGYKLLDGGLTDPIPLNKAIEDGYEKIIVVLTRDKCFEAKPYKLIKAYKAKYFRYSKLIKSLEKRYIVYNEIREKIKNLDKEGKIVAIYPSEELKIKNLENNPDKLKHIYDLGYQDGIEMINKIKAYLGRGNNR